MVEEILGECWEVSEGGGCVAQFKQREVLLVQHWNPQ